MSTRNSGTTATETQQIESANAAGDSTSNGARDESARRRSPKALLAFRPYLTRHPKMLAAALAALVVSALAMLAVPIAVRQMIDLGFGGSDGVMIDRYFAMIIIIGVVLAFASASRSRSTGWANASSRTFAPTSSGIWQLLGRPSSSAPCPVK